MINLSIPSPPSSLAILPKSYDQELQIAFENGDIDQICHLLDLGANPHQTIELNEKVIKNFLIEANNLEYPQSSAWTRLHNLPSLKQLLDQAKASYSSKNKLDLNSIYTALYTIRQASIFKDPSEIYPKASLMALALCVNQLKLVKKLVNSGFDFLNSESMSDLKGAVYRYYATPLVSEPPSSGYGCTSYFKGYLCSGIKYFGELSFNDPISDKILEDMYEVQDIDYSIGKKLYEDLKETHSLSITLSPYPILGHVDSLSDTVNYELIDYLLSLNISPDDIIKFDLDFYCDLKDGLFSGNTMTEFLLQRGFGPLKL